jgi:DHA3 family multidrug efflux protein-like MFS transporter
MFQNMLRYPPDLLIYEPTNTLFYHVLANNLLSGITNNLVWFALTFWVYIETESVLATSWIAGTFAIAGMFGGFIFGPIVDRERKKTALIQSSLMSLVGLLYWCWLSTSPTVQTPGKNLFHQFFGH